MGILVYWFIVIKIRLLVEQLAEELVNCIKTKATGKTGSYAPQFESNFNNLKIVCFTFTDHSFSKIKFTTFNRLTRF